MKIPKWIILCAVIAAAPSCTTITADSETSVKAERGVPGGEIIKTTTVNATVTGIDTTKRDVTMVTRHGEKFTAKAGPEVVNFDQIRVGDQLKVSLKEHLLIRMAKPGENLADESYATANLAEVGAKPGAGVSSTVQYVATVTAIDSKRRKATLEFSDGSTGRFDVRPDVDLTRHKVGEKVLIRNTETFAVSMSKP